jgi:hypothetical protein
MGDTTPPSGLDNHWAVVIAIRDNYNPEAASACKSDYDIEGIMAQLTDRLGKIGKNNEDATKTWKDAIALFQGKTTGTPAYLKLQQRLLGAELARQ